MLNQSVDYLERLKISLQKLDLNKLELLKIRIGSLIGTNYTLFICGNGGSAATSSHLACDLGKTILGRYPRRSYKRLRVISLNDSIPTLTAWGNDEGYEHIFAEQLKNLGKKKDLLIVITGSGNSANILKVLKEARKLGVKTFGFLGFNGGKAKNLVDDFILVESNDYGIIEDTHHIVIHLITDYFKNFYSKATT